MPVSCCAPGCTNRHTKGSTTKFYRIPRKNTEKRSSWIIAIDRQLWDPSDHDRICSQHFVYGRPSQDPSHVDFVPTVFSFCVNQRSRLLKSKSLRHKRAKEMQARLQQQDGKICDEAVIKPATPRSLYDSNSRNTAMDTAIADRVSTASFTCSLVEEPTVKRTKIFFPSEKDDKVRRTESYPSATEMHCGGISTIKTEIERGLASQVLSIAPKNHWQESMLLDERIFIQKLLRDNCMMRTKIEQLNDHINELQTKVVHQRVYIEKLEDGISEQRRW